MIFRKEFIIIIGVRVIYAIVDERGRAVDELRGRISDKKQLRSMVECLYIMEKEKKN